jgi:hypothetical protein
MICRYGPSETVKRRISYTTPRKSGKGGGVAVCKMASALLSPEKPDPVIFEFWAFGDDEQAANQIIKNNKR